MIRKIYKHRKLLLIVPLLVLKYSVLKLVLSNKGFFHYIDKSSRSDKIVLNWNFKQPKHVILGQVKKITRRFLPTNSCLVESLVQKDVLKLFGYDAEVNLSIYKIGKTYRTHAWINSPSMKDYKTLHKI